MEFIFVILCMFNIDVFESNFAFVPTTSRFVYLHNKSNCLPSSTSKLIIDQGEEVKVNVSFVPRLTEIGLTSLPEDVAIRSERLGLTIG